MMAQGKDVSELFPAVVKNVVSKNIEVNISIIFFYDFVIYTFLHLCFVSL